MASAISSGAEDAISLRAFIKASKAGLEAGSSMDGYSKAARH